MAYSLQYRQPVMAFLRGYTGMSRRGRVRLFAHLHTDLGEHGDMFRQQPELRLKPGDDYFWYYLALWDADGDGRVRHFSFVVSDAAAAYGVLQV